MTTTPVDIGPDAVRAVCAADVVIVADPTLFGTRAILTDVALAGSSR